MRTRRALYPQTSEMYICELDQCPLCGEQLELSRYSSGHKIVQKLSSISEAQVRHLYHERYLPLLASQERTRWDELEQVSREFGMILSLDGLAPEGGEPQLWVVRELQTGLTVRSGWLSEQGQHAFENFLRPIAETDLTVRAVLSDKQRGLLPAVNEIFPEARHAFCQLHYLKNIAEPAASARDVHHSAWQALKRIKALGKSVIAWRYSSLMFQMNG